MSYGYEKPIVIWAYGYYVEVARQAIEQYRSITGVEIEVIEIHSEDIERLLQINLVNQNLDELPNIILVQDQDIKKYLEKFQDLFSELEEYLDPSVYMSCKRNNIAYDGHIYACPITGGPIALYYNKTLMEEEGEEIPDEISWEDYIEIGRRLKERTGKYLLPPANFFFHSLVGSTGRLYYNENGDIEADGTREALELIERLLEADLLYPNIEARGDDIYALLAQGEIFSVIGGPYIFSRIKQLSENESEYQDWVIARLPKTETLMYDVDLGGYSWLVINKENITDQQAVFDFLTQLFNSANEYSIELIQEMSELYDMVPSVNYAGDILDALNNNEYFNSQNVIKYLWEISERAAELYYGRYTSELTEQLTTIVKDVAAGNKTPEDGYLDFEQICDRFNDGDNEPPPPRALVRIEIEQPPEKTEYYKYEAFSSLGMQVRAYYSDGTDEIVNFWHYSPSVLTMNDSYVTVSYTFNNKTKTAKQAVTVLDRKMQSITVKARGPFLHGDTLKADLFTVTVNYDKGPSRDVSATDIDPLHLERVGEEKVNILYMEDGDIQSAEIIIDVQRKLEYIAIAEKPDKSSYYKGEFFDRTGLRVRAYYSDDTTGTIYSGSLNITPLVVKFDNGKDRMKLNIKYIERGVSAETSIFVYKKTGMELDECDDTQDMAECGVGKVNLSSGQLRYIIEDYVGSDSTFPITVSHVYNRDIKSEYNVGVNWRLNLQQEIVLENKQWKYTDAEGKEYYFDSGYESEDERSSVRNEKLGLDLFIDSENDVIKLVDRDNNTLVFERINGVYRLIEIHNFPSVYDKVLEAYSMKLGYDSLNRLAYVEAGKRVNNIRPRIDFHYDGGNLTALRYNQTTVAEYTYNGDELSKITKCNASVEENYSRSTLFEYESGSFKIFDLSSEDNEGNYKSLIYIFNTFRDRVESYSFGYGDDERDITNISYTSNKVFSEESDTEEPNTDVVLSAVKCCKENVSVISFNELGVLSQYSYEMNDEVFSYTDVKRVTGAQSRGFDYQTLADTFSDTLDVYCDEFESGSVNGWSGGTISSRYAINGLSCLRGYDVSKTYTLSSNDITDDTTLFLSLWVLSTSEQEIAVKINVQTAEESSEIVHKLDKNLFFWQFTAFELGKRKVGDKITVTITGSGTLYVDDVRLTKLSYENPDDIPDSEYDAFDKVTKSYQYNPVDKEIQCTEYTYNAGHQLQEQKVTVGNVLKSKEIYTYTDGLLTSRAEYGTSSSVFTEERYEYLEGALSKAIDANNVVTQYIDGVDYKKIITVGETGSPDMEQKGTFFTNSDTIKTVSSGALQNEFVYFQTGNLQKAKFHYSSSSYNGGVSFEYDTFGNLKKLKIGTLSLVTMKYDRKHLNETVYANGDTVSYAYDSKDRITAIKENGTEFASLSYSDNAENLVTITHSDGLTYSNRDINKNGLTSEYCIEYLGVNRMLKFVGYAAEKSGNITSVGYFIDGGDRPFEKRISTKDGNGLLVRMEREYHGAQNTYSYDSLYQLISKTITYQTGNRSKQYQVSYGYENIHTNCQSTRIATEGHYDGLTWTRYYYEYYKNGNLKSIKLGSDFKNKYVYDEYGRLTEEYNYELSRAYKFSYDNGGNIVKKETYYITDGIIDSVPKKIDIYDYNTVTAGCGHNSAWTDQLKSYNGTIIRYDESGNPLDYFGKAMVWRGRKLMNINGVAMDYDCSGLRTKKGDKIYYWLNGNLIMERWLKNGSEQYIYYYYDESGVCGMNYNGTEYYFRKNIFGDVLAVYDGLGNLQCRYVYDAWGNHKVYNANGNELGTEADNVGNVNSFRYRSYYWDSEFGLYYLQSRYYDPVLGRFISADAISYLNPEDVVGFNLYSYCGNNPVMGIDPNGTFDWARFGRGLAIVAGAVLAIAVTVGTFGTGSVVGGAIIAGTIGAAGDMFSQTVIEGKTFAEVNYCQVAASGISGALSAIPGVGYWQSVAISGVAGGVSALVEGQNLYDAALAGLKSAGITALAGGITRGIGLGKISKIGKGNYAGKKVFLNHTGMSKLSSFNPAVNKSQSLLGYIYQQIGLKGLSQLANDTAGKVVNTIADIVSSIIP